MDFAIIVALQIEREAVVNRLDGVERMQIDGEPLSFYQGRIEVAGGERPYTLVVVQLLEMGNTEASIATTRVIQRWQPRNVIMVGIAGGVPGKVQLGDVVVSQYSYYYEPAKLQTGDVEHRGRQFNCDRVLYGRARAYEAAEWRTHIGVARPDSASDPKLPAVHFGPIACGEKVIADIGQLARISAQCPKMLAVAMEGAGVAQAVLSEGSPPRYLEIRGVSDYAGPDKNDAWHDYAANSVAAFTVGFLRSRPVPPQEPLSYQEGKATAGPTVVLLAQSLRPIGNDEILPALPADYRAAGVQILRLDLTDLVRNKVLSDPAEAARRLADTTGPLVGAIGGGRVGRLVFHGLAAIPPVILAGHVVTDRHHVRLFDYHPETGTWIWPGPDEPYPELGRQGLPRKTINTAGDATIRVSVSYRILAVQTEALGLDAPLQIDLSLADPARNVVCSETQVRAYGRIFRETLDQIHTVMPRCRRVHLFYAGPMALAFHIGQQISENIHPPVAVWNFAREYEWAIDLAAAVIGQPCVLRRQAERPMEESA